VELGSGIAKALLASGEGAEVFYRLGDDIVKELKVDATRLCYGGVLAMEVDGGVDFATDVDGVKLYTWRHGGVNMEGQRNSRNLLFAAPLEVTLPDLSTSTSGPSHCTSKYDLMAMLYADGVKKRLLAGARREEALARTADSAAERSWWVCCMTAEGGVMR
jgi:hypothetical protein